MASSNALRRNSSFSFIPLLSHLREVMILVGGYFTYMLVRKLIGTDLDNIALENASKVIRFEVSLGFFWEPHWQGWAADSAKNLLVFLNWSYILTFFPVILTTAVILYSKDRPKYRYYRNVVLLSFIIALIMFAIFPLAPPRFLPEYGFIDAIAQYGPTWYASRDAAAYYNAFAAMPSLHFGWTILFGVLFFRTGKPALRVWGILYPTLTFFAITVTGNHYVIDAVGGGILVLCSFLLYEAILRYKVKMLPHFPNALFPSHGKVPSAGDRIPTK